MGLPLIIAAALAAAGTGMSIAGNVQSQDAMNAAVAEEMRRQRKYKDQSKNIFEESLGQSTEGAAKKQISQGEQNALQEYAKLQALPNSSGSASPIAGGNRTVDDARTKAFVGMRNVPAAQLFGGTEWQLQQRLKDMQAQQLLGVNASNARQSAAIMPMEVQAASHAGDNLKGFGSIASMLGMAAGLYGAASAPAAAGASAANNAGALEGQTLYSLTPGDVANWNANLGAGFTTPIM